MLYDYDISSSKVDEICRQLVYIESLSPQYDAIVAAAVLTHGRQCVCVGRGCVDVTSAIALQGTLIAAVPDICIDLVSYAADRHVSM